MNRIELVIPKGIRYVSDMGAFNIDPLNLIESGHCIVDKVLPGCGFTHYALTCKKNVILCSPRKMLLQNKFDQDVDGNLYLVVNDLENTLMIDRENTRARDIASIASFMSELTERLGADKASKEVVVKYSDDGYDKVYSREYDGIRTYINNQIFKGAHEDKVYFYKIMVTYDSFHMVRDILKSLNLLDSFTIMIDEFQTIFQDARFKATMENKFLSSLMGLSKVYFVSATPMLDKYLDMLDEFKNMTYYRFDWHTKDPRRIITPDLKLRSLNGSSTVGMIKRIVDKYREGDLVGSINPVTNAQVYSREAVFYLNSVNKIISAIKKCRLRPEEVNILCSDTPENRQTIMRDPKLRALGKFEIGKVPLKNEPRKMFTFCTRTVYLGADFYSDNARSFVFADSNYDCLAVDISQDLPQILGRQRLNENPWKNSATFFFTPTYVINAKTREDFKRVIEGKLEETRSRITGYRGTTTPTAKKEYLEMCKKLEIFEKFASNYVSVIFNETLGKYIPVENKLVRISELRAFEIQQVDYKDRFSVFNVVQQQFNLNAGGGSVILFEQLPSFEDRLKFLCEGPFSDNIDEINFLLNTLEPEDPVKKSYLVLGRELCRTVNYNKRNIYTILSKKSFDYSMLDSLVYEKFKEGDVITMVDIKGTLDELYKSVRLCPFTATATDISYFFETKKSKRTINGVRGINVFILGRRLR